MRCRILVCSLMLLGLVVTGAQAGSMTLMANVVDRWALDFSVSGLPVVFDGDGRVSDGQPGNYEIEVSFTAQDSVGEKGWLNTLFSSTPTGGVSNISGTWSAINPLLDINGPTPPGATTPVYGTNQDAGIDSNDLQQIIVSLASAALPADHAFDKRNEVGTPNAPPAVMVGGGASGLGRYFVSWDGTTDGELNLLPHAFSFSLLTNTPGPEQLGTGANIGFGSSIVPDEFDVFDLFLGGKLPGQIVSGGPLPTDDSDDPDSVAWALVSLIGPDGAEVGATVDPLTGVFTWDSAPTDSRGQYTATISGTNVGSTPVGTDQGLLTFNLVPEPTSITLFGLAMVGAVGFLRRR